MMCRWMALALLLAGCSSETPRDPSGDGGAGGGDPSADGDADYLSDAEEASLGTDPLDPDSDDDGYLDGDEVLEQTDPLDPESKIYRGGWPYQRFKDDIADPGFGGAAEAGAVLPRLVSVDQFGDTVDLYDFAMHGKPVVIDLSAGWCAACLEMAAWLEGEAPDLAGDASFNAIPEMVAAGEIYWITVVFEDAAATPADGADVAQWYGEYPNPHVAVLADDDRALFDHLWPGAYPFVTVIESDMTLRVYDRFDYKPALASLLP